MVLSQYPYLIGADVLCFVTWQLLKHNQFRSLPTSCLLAPDLISPQAFSLHVHLTSNVHIILWRVEMHCYPILLMGKQRSHWS